MSQEPPDYYFVSSLKEEIRHNLSRFDRKEQADETLRRAAVAIVVDEDPDTGRACFFLTRRPERPGRHSGQFALPGGTLEKSESEVQAALREVQEEIGLRLNGEDVLGILDDYSTRSGFRVTPIVAWNREPQQVSIDPVEVAEYFRVPLSDLTRHEVPKLQHVEGMHAPVLSAPLRSISREVFAPTAAMLYQFREVCLFGRPTRVARYEQPRFAWR